MKGGTDTHRYAKENPILQSRRKWSDFCQRCNRHLTVQERAVSLHYISPFPWEEDSQSTVLILLRERMASSFTFGSSESKFPSPSISHLYKALFYLFISYQYIHIYIYMSLLDEIMFIGDHLIQVCMVISNSIVIEYSFPPIPSHSNLTKHRFRLHTTAKCILLIYISISLQSSLPLTPKSLFIHGRIYGPTIPVSSPIHHHIRQRKARSCRKVFSATHS